MDTLHSAHQGMNLVLFTTSIIHSNCHRMLQLEAVRAVRRAKAGESSSKSDELTHSPTHAATPFDWLIGGLRRDYAKMGYE